LAIRRRRRRAATHVPQVAVCPSCGHAAPGRYCTQCGERRPLPHDYSLKYYCLEVLELLTHSDSKVLRSSWLLVTRPGFLSREYLEGRRVRYLAPLRLFLLVSVVYFLSLSLYRANTLTTALSIQLHGNDYYAGIAAHAGSKLGPGSGNSQHGD
jgi:ribosomal protein L32